MPNTASFSAYSVDDLNDSVKNIKPFSPTMGIVFASPALGIPTLAETAASWGFPVFGCSTAGEILKGNKGSLILEQSAVCFVSDPDSSLFSISLFEKNNESSFNFGRIIGAWGKKTFDAPAFIIAISGLTNDGEAIIRGIESVSPPGTLIYGGVAGDDAHFQ